MEGPDVIDFCLVDTQNINVKQFKKSSFMNMIRRSGVVVVAG